jgi:hypothetical protein
MTTAEHGAEHVQHLLGAYVLSALPADEDLVVSRHLAVCRRCADEAADLQDVRRLLDRLDDDRVARLLEAVGRTPSKADMSGPDVTEPDVTRPDVTGPQVTEPQVTEPQVTEPQVTEPEAARPAPASPGAPIPDTPVIPSRRRSSPTPDGPTGPPGTRPSSPGRDRRRRPGRRWTRPSRLVLAALTITLAIGVGLGGWLANRDPVRIQLAGTQTNTQIGISVAVTVVGTGNGSRVDAHVEGLTVGQAYQLVAVGDRGESQTAVAWTARDRTHGVGGEVAIAIDRLTAVTLIQADGRVLVTVRLATQ